VILSESWKRVFQIECVAFQQLLHWTASDTFIHLFKPFYVSLSHYQSDENCTDISFPWLSTLISLHISQVKLMKNSTQSLRSRGIFNFCETSKSSRTASKQLENHHQKPELPKNSFKASEKFKTHQKLPLPQQLPV
jgi:hypothetical protein